MATRAVAVECFGLHWIDNIAWLVQSDEVVNFVGLRQKIRIKNPGGECPHQIPTEAEDPDQKSWKSFLNLASDPLVRAMLPIPHPPGSRTFFLQDGPRVSSELLLGLARLSSPVSLPVKPMWMLRKAIIRRELEATNLQPLIVTGITSHHRAMMEMLVEYAQYTPRTTILVGASEVVVPPSVERIETKLDQGVCAEIEQLPMEVIGALIIRRHARMESI